MHVYLDNAATTAPYPEVIEAMKPYLTEFYGNPSSTHAIGRKARTVIEQARKTIAKLIGASSSEIIFTSGGTEAINIFLQGIASSVPHVISSAVEHPAVLQTLAQLAKDKVIEITWLALDKNGKISQPALENAILANPGALVVLMHGNNEIGNLLQLEKLAMLCSENSSPLFTDAVQTIGHYAFDVNLLKIAGLSASAHKFHGPKGVGFLYLKQGTKLTGLYRGGEQERSLRVGTENVAGIVGMAKALEISSLNLKRDRQHIELLKTTLIGQLTATIPGIRYNGTSSILEESMFTVLSVSIPKSEQNEMLIFNLDMANIAVSAGSACASGAVDESHVLKAVNHDPERAVIRFSLSKFNTLEEIKFAVKKLEEIYK